MAGELNGLQAKVSPLALFTHCCAHRLNLTYGPKVLGKNSPCWIE
jgi:hypothetical protein